MIAVVLELVASPLKSGRDLGEADRSALVIGRTEKIRTRGTVVSCKVVAVVEAQVSVLHSGSVVPGGLVTATMAVGAGVSGWSWPTAAPTVPLYRPGLPAPAGGRSPQRGKVRWRRCRARGCW